MIGENASSSLGLSFLAVAGGLVMLITGGELLVSGATGLARRLGMSSLVIGLTVVAFGTSVPELFVSLTASLQGHPEIMIGNVVGSNIANIGLILGICGLISPLRLELKEVGVELLLVICGSIVLILFTMTGVFSRLPGLLFVCTLVSYTVFTYRNSNRQNGTGPAGEKGGQRTSAWIASFQVMTGLVLLGSGSNLFIDGATDMAHHFGVSELVIGLTLAAVGTSLPELASSLAALRRGETDLLLGNVIGSNMFNLFMVLGLTGLIRPFALSPQLLSRDLGVMLAFSLALFPLLRRYGGTSRLHGFLFLAGYCVYCASLV